MILIEHALDEENDVLPGPTFKKHIQKYHGKEEQCEQENVLKFNMELTKPLSRGWCSWD